MDRSGAASETPALQRRLHAMADMRSVATPLLFQAQFGRWSPPEARFFFLQMRSPDRVSPVEVQGQIS
eukprot:8898984-Prorocentrum_lima.AAC.1